MWQNWALQIKLKLNRHHGSHLQETQTGTSIAETSQDIKTPLSTPLLINAVSFDENTKSKFHVSQEFTEFKKKGKKM